MKPPNAIPAMLVETGLQALPRQLRLLRRDGGSPSEYVGVFLDGRVAPGRTLAISEARKHGITLAEAIARVEAAIRAARKQGRIFALGLMLSPEECLDLFRRIGGQQKGVDEVAAWLREPLTDRLFRLAIVAGSATQLQLVSLDALTP